MHTSSPSVAVDVALVASLMFVYALVSRRLAATAFTGAAVFMVAGLVLGPELLGVFDIGLGHGAISAFARLTLALVLFSDATRIDRRLLRKGFAIPGRLVGVGLPLTVLVGTLAGIVLFGAYGWWEAALLAAILAPTDIALCQAAVTNGHVPAGLRQAINVEAGLSDGIAAPLVTLFITGVAVSEGFESQSEWYAFALREIGFGIGVGLLGGIFAAMCLNYAERTRSMDALYRQICMVAIAVALHSFAIAIEGNGFVAAFVGGLAVGNLIRVPHEGYFEFIEEEGQMLLLFIFFLFGASILGPELGNFTWQMAVYAVLSLTLIRMLPVAIALIGLGLTLPSKFFLAWFGPRGLGSIVFLLSALSLEAAGPGGILEGTVALTVALSVLLHGTTADGLGTWIARKSAKLSPGDAEHAPVLGLRPRFRLRRGPEDAATAPAEGTSPSA